MGYSYENGRLCCDNCGVAGGVRKRTCPHKVRYAEGGSLPYCPAPALCKACWEKLGKNAIHKECKEGAARSQAREDAQTAALDAGEHIHCVSYGDWHDRVPEGMVAVGFRGRSGEEYRLISHDVFERFSERPIPTLENLSLTGAEPWNPRG